MVVPMDAKNGGGGGPRRTGMAWVLEKLAAWAAIAALAVLISKGAIAYGEQRERINALDEDLAEVVASVTALSDSIGLIREASARDDERIKQIKESTDEIKDDLKTIIREIRTGGGRN